ncbi:MAG: putative glycine dehydrogenase (decarboxylating) subunit 2 [Planctomycetaceae bacterium]|nr:MAG: putative glycine dehydrogenase (decarboxylating) subunit 2 [Planctomycetaceae bacterium]
MDHSRLPPLLSELSRTGRRGVAWPDCDVPVADVSQLLPAEHLAQQALDLPEVGEQEVLRHFVNLSRLNFSVDTHFYPLGSCTMKYNPKRHERWARLPGIVDVHPYQHADDVQGLWHMLYELQTMLGEIAGLPAVSLQPAAGAQGELTALLIAAAWFRDRGEQQRTRVVFPASAHGTNPASAALAGFETVQLPHSRDGLVDVSTLTPHLDERLAVFMITNPNTLGLFEREIGEIARRVHQAGGLVYIDGANMNAILGITRPGDFGGDMMHFNVHKTFTGPHGAGGPGAGPIAVRSDLAEYLPGPVLLRQHGRYVLHQPARSIGRVRSHFGNVGILLRGYFYLKTMGAAGLKAVAEHAVLHANYLQALLKEILPVPYGRHCMHEFVASAQQVLKERGLSAMDLAKRLLDYGYHAPTVYFPLVVPEAVMIEPTETETRATLDAFADALRAIITTEPVEVVKTAPHHLPVSRPNEVQAARQPICCWYHPASAPQES